MYLLSPAEVSCGSPAGPVVAAQVVDSCILNEGLSIYLPTPLPHSHSFTLTVCRSLGLYLCSPLSKAVHLLHSSSAEIIFYATKQPQDAHLDSPFLFTSTPSEAYTSWLNWFQQTLFPARVSERVWYPLDLHWCADGKYQIACLPAADTH